MAGIWAFGHLTMPRSAFCWRVWPRSMVLCSASRPWAAKLAFVTLARCAGGAATTLSATGWMQGRKAVKNWQPKNLKVSTEASDWLVEIFWLVLGRKEWNYNRYSVCLIKIELNWAGGQDYIRYSTTFLFRKVLSENWRFSHTGTISDIVPASFYGRCAEQLEPLCLPGLYLI